MSPDKSEPEMSFDETVAPDGLLTYKIDWSQIEKKEGKRRSFYIKLYDKKKNLLYKPYIDKPSAAFYTDLQGKVSLLAGSNLKFDESVSGMALVAIEDGGEETGVCECEARIRAFMRMIRIGEGTKDDGGYTRIVGGSSFADHGKDMSDHPKVYIKKHNSTAAGAYQITKTNWNSNPLKHWRTSNVKWIAYKKRHKLKIFSKEAQDAYGIYLVIGKKKAFKEINKGAIKEAIAKCATEWASLPGAGYGQREEKLSVLITKYKEYLKEELENTTSLHIRKGFLKELFEKSCCKSKINGSSSLWHNPLANMQLRGWYTETQWTPEKSEYHGRTGGKHDGLDLYAPVGTDLFACVDGEVYLDYTSTTYGKTIGIKGEYNSQTYYFFYAHLSVRSVSKGDTVKAGDKIGESGQTGNAQGQAAKMAHLHFEVRTTSNKSGGRIDPYTIEELKLINKEPLKTSQS